MWVIKVPASFFTIFSPHVDVRQLMKLLLGLLGSMGFSDVKMNFQVLGLSVCRVFCFSYYLISISARKSINQQSLPNLLFLLAKPEKKLENWC